MAALGVAQNGLETRLALWSALVLNVMFFTEQGHLYVYHNEPLLQPGTISVQTNVNANELVLIFASRNIRELGLFLVKWLLFCYCHIDSCRNNDTLCGVVNANMIMTVHSISRVISTSL